MKILLNLFHHPNFVDYKSVQSPPQLVLSVLTMHWQMTMTAEQLKTLDKKMGPAINVQASDQYNVAGAAVSKWRC